MGDHSSFQFKDRNVPLNVWTTKSFTSPHVLLQCLIAILGDMRFGKSTTGVCPLGATWLWTAKDKVKLQPRKTFLYKQQQQ